MPDAEPEATVVVGVDGSERALDAVDLAAVEAQLFGCRLEVVHAFVWPEVRVPFGSTVTGSAEVLRREAERVVEEAVERARGVTPDAVVVGKVVTGGPAPVLLRAGADAALLVIADRGLGGFTGLLVGSVAVALVTYGRCPVLVLRGRAAPTGPVVVGIDGSAPAMAALDLALAYAAAHACPLRVVHVAQQHDADPLDGARRHLDERQRHLPAVPVERVVHEGDVRATLTAESRAARLVVVGSRGRGGFAGMLLGSVSQAVLHHADCPVVVVPPATGPIRLLDL